MPNKSTEIITDSEATHEISLELTREEYDLLRKIADLRGVEDWELLRHYLQGGLDADAESKVEELLPIDDVEGLIVSISDLKE